MEGQPQGAGGHNFGVEGMATLQVTVENTGVTQMIPCYLLDSAKPISRADLGFHIVVVTVESGTNLTGAAVKES